MNYFKLQIGGFLQEIDEQEALVDEKIKNYKKELKKFAKIASEKKNESIIDRLSKLDTSSPGVLNLSRRKLRELNASRSDTEKIKIPSIDVGDIIKHKRRTLIKSRNTTFVKNESLRADATFTKNASISKNDSNLNDPNATYTVERDFVTPDNDTPLMELKRKQIEEELNRSVTTRKPLRKFNNLEGTPVVGETSTANSVTSQSPTNSAPRPRKLIGLRKDLQDISMDESESTIELQPVAPIRITFDDLHTDDDISDDETLDIYPPWSKNWRQVGRVQYLTNSDLVDTLFCQEINIEAKELFPNASPTKMLRRRSSIMWTEQENVL